MNGAKPGRLRDFQALSVIILGDDPYDYSSMDSMFSFASHNSNIYLIGGTDNGEDKRSPIVAESPLWNCLGKLCDCMLAFPSRGLCFYNILAIKQKQEKKKKNSKNKVEINLILPKHVSRMHVQ